MAAFEIDDRKLRRGVELIPTSRTLDDDKRDLVMVGRLIAAPLLLVAALGLVLVSLLSRL